MSFLAVRNRLVDEDRGAEDGGKKMDWCAGRAATRTTPSTLAVRATLGWQGVAMGDDRPTDQELDRLQWTTVLYYLHETNPDNGLVSCR